MLKIQYLICFPEKLYTAGCQMLDIAFHTILLEDIFKPIDIDSGGIKQLLQDATKGDLDVNNITSSKVLKVTQQKLNQNLPIHTSNHTAKLWIQYFHLNDFFGNIQGLRNLGIENYI